MLRYATGVVIRLTIPVRLDSFAMPAELWSMDCRARARSQFYIAAASWLEISCPIASEAVAPGLGAFSTCNDCSAIVKLKSCTVSPLVEIACARTPEPPGSRSCGRTSGTNAFRDRQNRVLLNDRRSSLKHRRGYFRTKRQKPT